jgi:hypothetical protein
VKYCLGKGASTCAAAAGAVALAATGVGLIADAGIVAEIGSTALGASRALSVVAFATTGDPVQLLGALPGVGQLEEGAAAVRTAEETTQALRAVSAGEEVASEGGNVARAAESCANSFTAETPVLMANGDEEPIADVKVGDTVLATDPEADRSEAKSVVALIRHSGKHRMVDLALSDGSKISTTDHHPFWDASARAFTDAVDLHIGDRVLRGNGGTLTIAGARVYERILTAYNLQIDGIHTYYAGATPVLVHNSCDLGLDATGKVHGNLPSYVPGDWTAAELEQLESDLHQSIATRQDEQLRLGEEAGHRARIGEERDLLRQVQKVLSGS